LDALKNLGEDYSDIFRPSFYALPWGREILAPVACLGAEGRTVSRRQ
jgi:hypothetical protein